MFDCSRLSSSRTFRVITDVALLLLVIIPIAFFHLGANPYKRGFFCNDDSLRYPYLDSTVPVWLLQCFGFILPLTTIIVTESLFRGFYSGDRRSNKSCFWECYGHIFVFLFGVGCTELLTDIGKYTIGRLRPHFFQVCSPTVNCSDPRLKNVYIENYECRGRDEHLLREMRLSFPSGHSSFSAYSMVFLAMYCSARLVCKGAKWVKHTIQYFAIALAIYTGLSRVSDYKHHWSDVLAGLALGTLSAVLIVLYVSDLFTRRSHDGNAASAASPAEDVPLADNAEGTNHSYAVI